MRYAVWSSDVSMDKREEIKAVFNQKDNQNGSKLRILIISPSGKEGLSLYNVKQIHILEPYWNMKRIEQIIGRGVRYCSHKHLPENTRNVKVYIYLATYKGSGNTIDMYIQKMALGKDKLISKFEMAIKESAIDCSLFHNANSDKTEKIKCDK